MKKNDTIASVIDPVPYKQAEGGPNRMPDMTMLTMSGNDRNIGSSSLSRTTIAKQVYIGCRGERPTAISASRKATTAKAGTSRALHDSITNMHVSSAVQASCFAYYAHAKRKKSLRHFATLTATFNAHFRELGTFEELRSDWRLRHRPCILRAAFSSDPAGTGSLSRPQEH